MAESEEIEPESGLQGAGTEVVVGSGAEEDSTQLEIPEALAYQGRPGRPQGTLVVDEERLEIKGG